MRLGIQHQRIHPASPQENGAHERMHRTLKAGACRPPRAQLPLYPVAPALSRAPAAPRVPGPLLVKRITNAGTFRLKHKLLFLANPLEQQLIGLDETADGIWSISFGMILLGKVDERDMIIRD